MPVSLLRHWYYRKVSKVADAVKHNHRIILPRPYHVSDGLSGFDISALPSDRDDVAGYSRSSELATASPPDDPNSPVERLAQPSPLNLSRGPLAMHPTGGRAAALRTGSGSRTESIRQWSALWTPSHDYSLDLRQHQQTGWRRRAYQGIFATTDAAETWFDPEGVAFEMRFWSECRRRL
jgi:hypothetical protein